MSLTGPWTVGVCAVGGTRRPTTLTRPACPPHRCGMTLLTPAEYADLLVERARAEDQRIGAATWARTLPEMMVRAGDEHLVDVDAITAEADRLLRAEQTPVRTRRPRTVRGADHWRAELARIDAALKVESERNRLGTTDIAAYAGIGVRRTARQQRRDGAAMDRSIERTARLLARRATVAAKLTRAEAEA